jgi:peptide/nickel transport system permease protein
LNFLVKRGITYLIVLFAALNIAFFVPRLAAGNPADILTSDSIGLHAAQTVALRLGLNTPIYEQYITFWKNVFSWPPYFGVSFQYYPNTVTYTFAVRMQWSAILLIMSFVMATIFSYIMAAIGTLRRGGKYESTALSSSITVHAIPTYWIAMVLLWVFAVTLHLVPFSGQIGFNPGTGWSYVYSAISHAIMPSIALALPLMAENYLVLRASTADVIRSDYVNAAEARGLRDRTLMGSYIMRNSVLPFVSVTSFAMANLVGRLILVEVVFAYTGVGDLIVDAVIFKDYPVIVGSIFFITLLVVVGGFIGDIILSRLDPRINK